MSARPDDPAALLAPTPYSIGDGSAALARFLSVANGAREVRARAIRAARAISEEAKDVLPQFEAAVRSDLVAESNRMEGIETSSSDVRDLTRVRQELLTMEISSFLAFVRDDARVLESLGLYRAYAIADEWASANARPRQFELRQLHRLVMPTLRSGGRYKTQPRGIEGSDHEPTPIWDLPRVMSELAAWFADGTGDPLLDATVVHAWLTHVHPFDDGNGRMARLLANLALVQSNYPPLLLRSSSDRGKYLDALVASDEGDILPLYDLFLQATRRVVRNMERPDYVAAKIRNELLRTSRQRYDIWRAQAKALYTCVEQKLRHRPGWGVSLMGYPDQEGYALLEEMNSAGNCWFLKLRYQGIDEWLLWFGFRSVMLRDLMGSETPWPSIFLSRRSDDPAAVHKFSPPLEAAGARPAEISITPGARRPAVMRWDTRVKEMHIDEAVTGLVDALCR
jgi:Fic family protein